MWEFELIHDNNNFLCKMPFLDDRSDDSPRSEAEFQQKLRLMKKRKAANVKRGHEPPASSKYMSLFQQFWGCIATYRMSEKSKFLFFNNFLAKMSSLASD